MTWQSFFSFCVWDIPAALLLAAVIVFFAVWHHRNKVRIGELKDQLSDLYAEDMIFEAEQTEGAEAEDAGADSAMKCGRYGKCGSEVSECG